MTKITIYVPHHNALCLSLTKATILNSSLWLTNAKQQHTKQQPQQPVAMRYAESRP